MPDLSGRALVKGVLWNFGGHVLPLAVGILTIPKLLMALGAEQFGVLSLAWALVGYFSVFDLGVGAAVVKLVAQRLGAGQYEQVLPIVGTATIAMSALGMIAGIALLVGAPTLTAVLNVSEPHKAAATSAFQLLGLSIPLVMITAVMQGAIAALQRFDLNNKIRVPLGIWSFVGPLLAALGGYGVEGAAAALLLGRFFAAAISVAVCWKLGVFSVSSLKLDRAILGELFTFGKWVAISNVLSPLMSYFDRFAISAIVSPGVVVYYTVPYDLVNRLLVLPNAVLGVIFPALTTSLAASDGRTDRMLIGSTAAILVITFGLVLPLVSLANPLLTVWLGAEFAERSHLVMQVLCLGLLWNAVAHPLVASLHAANRPAWVAALHLCELPLFFLGLWLLTESLGVVGAAIAWTLRVMIDAVVLMVMSSRVYRTSKREVAALGTTMLAATVLLLLGFVVSSSYAKALLILFGWAAIALAVWHGLLTVSERKSLSGSLRRAVSLAPGPRSD
jgi:O-antigen/teichoic acid export membrane protein